MRLAFWRRRPKTNIFEWHRWFAWYPVFDRWADTKVTIIWMETVERQRCSTGYDPGCDTKEYWRYRPPRSIET